MARLPRLVIPGLPHHVTQRGNRRGQTFFEEDDYALYKYLLSEAAQKARAKIWCYCLMPNHVHVIIVPSEIKNSAASDRVLRAKKLHHSDMKPWNIKKLRAFITYHRDIPRAG